MGMKQILMPLLGLLLLPIWVRMQGWRLRIRHPDPRYLTTQGELYSTDNSERVLKGVIIRPGRSTWRPDPSAQVDEIKAQLTEQARKLDP